MKRLLRKILGSYYWWRYGVCPIHLTLARAGINAEPKWVCEDCDVVRVDVYEKKREKREHHRTYAMKRLRKLNED